MNDWPELLLIDKARELSSFGVIRELRKKYTSEHDGAKAPKMGHAGTLDPLATGLMLIGVGQGTKKLTEYIKLDKEYVAEVRIGERRTTGDLEGEVTEQVIVTELDLQQVKEELRGMIGVLTLPVSAYSAIKKDGVPMYKRARKAAETGEEVAEVPMRDMEVMEAQLLSLTCEAEYCVVTVRFFVRSGVYIRSLGEELGKRLGFPATLQALRRTQVGEFRVEDALLVEDSRKEMKTADPS